MGCPLSKPESPAILNNWVCLFCREHLFNHDVFQQTWQKRTSYITSWSQIQQSSGKGCQWCDLIFSQVDLALRTRRDQGQTEYQGTRESIERGADILSQETIEIGVSFRTDDGQTLLFLQYENASDGEALAMSCISVCASSDSEASKFIPTRPLVRQMSSKDTMQLALSTLDECLQGVESHSTCPRYTKSALPTRVIDCSDPEKPRLKMDVDGIEEPYVALSYVWGESQPQKTTTQNMAQYVGSGWNMDQTPQTIKDAVRVTHALRLRYLWVDAYCIIQDSADDKAREIRNMRRIFQGAYLTIIAAKTPKVTAGFLGDCPRPQPAFTVPFYCPGDGRPAAMTLLPRALGSRYEADKEPTNARGWCLEERILSPRALIYASNTLQYLCQRGSVNVGSSANLTRMSGIDRLPSRFFAPGAGGDLEPLDESTTRELTKVWHKVLQDFTPRGLTAPQDRLKAIAGVADAFHIRFQSRYVAGLWGHHLLGDLLWTKASADTHPGPGVYRAPSWSWASVDGAVYNPWPFVEPDQACCAILDCQVDLAHEGLPYGALTGGHLIARGRMIKFLWNSSRHFLYMLEPAGSKDEPALGAGDPDRLEDVRGDGEVVEVRALPLVQRPPKPTLGSPREERQKLPSLSGILLDISDTRRDCYRRVGFFSVSLTSEVAKLLADSAEQTVTVL